MKSGLSLGIATMGYQYTINGIDPEVTFAGDLDIDFVDEIISIELDTQNEIDIDITDDVFDIEMVDEF